MKFTPRIIWRIITRLILPIIIIFCAAVSYSGEVNSIKVRGKNIAINDTADQVFALLKESDMVDQVVEKDPNNPNSLLVVKNYNVKGKKFTLYFARVKDPGPYRVVRIVTN